MAARRKKGEDDAAATLGAAGSVVRRAPFASNPRVGARGQRTQQRILDAALEVFGEEGYDRCSIDPITNRAGCSRAAFYQYFSGKEDVFRQLTGQVARQLDASIEALEPLTPGEPGWLALRAWVVRHSNIYNRYQPVFHVFHEAQASDEAVATGSMRWNMRAVARMRSKLEGCPLPPRELDPVINQLLACVVRTHDVVRILRSAAPGHYSEERVGDALADVIHRSLFGLVEGVNVHGNARQQPPVLRSAHRDAFPPREVSAELTSTGRKTWEDLLDAGREAFVERGYHRTRVSDVVEAAGVSRGAFYRYFANTDELALILGARAMQTVSRVLAEVPSLADPASGRTALRRWLRRYNEVQANEAAMLQVWVDAALQDATLRANSAAALDVGRRAMVGFLEPRGFGDVDTEGLVMVALLSSFGAKERSTAEIDAVAHIVEQGFLGRDRR